MKTPAIISVGSTKFARNAAALVETLFQKDGTASGLFKARKHSVLFSDAKGEPFACLVANPGQSKFFVSASKQTDGRIWYNFGLTDSAKALLGLAEFGPAAQSDEAARVWDLVAS